jgi:glycosyltransferase involved in cell wall biosynthesis
MRTLAIMHVADVGGPPQHVRPWLRGLAERGTVEVVAPAPGRVLDLYRDVAATTVLRYEPLTFPHRAGELAGLPARLGREVAVFRRHIVRTRPDLVFVVTSVLPAALLAARLAGVPALVYVGEIFHKRFVRSAPRSAASWAVARLTERLASALVCCSHTVAAQFERRDGRIVEAVYHGVDRRRTAALAEADGRGPRPAGPGGPCLAVIGNLTRGRGQDLVVRALPALAREFPHVTCTVAGTPLPRPDDAAYAEELRALAADLGVADRVTFAGFVDPISDVYAAADVVVNPARFNEPFGQVAIEALAAGRPVVATCVGAIPEVLRDGVDALLVDPDDPAAIARSVARLWSDAALRRRLVESGRERVRTRFDEERGVERFARVVADLTANGRQGAAEGLRRTTRSW